MATCIDVMADAMKAASTGGVESPARLFTPLIDGSGTLALMPGSIAEPGIFGAKIISILGDNLARELSVIQGFITLFDHGTGTPIALIEGSSVTAIRTAAASGLATKLLAHDAAKTHGIFGTGVQAASHIDAIAAARPNLRDVIVRGRSSEKTAAFVAKHARRTGLNIRQAATAEEAGSCDVVSTTTAATSPILKGAWLQPGAHVNLVGAYTPETREADTDAIIQSKIYVDLMHSALAEAGDLLIPINEGAIAQSAIVGEIGRVVAGERPGRVSETEITLYKSLGIVAQDLFAAHAVYLEALKQNTGTVVEF